MTDRPIVVIPVKSFGFAKTRLAGSLDGAQRAALGEALAARTAWTARDAGADVVVVAGSDEVRGWAVRTGFASVAQPDDEPGLDAAARLGLGIAADRHTFVVHADLPLVTAPLLRSVFRIRNTVIAPSHDGGTSLLGGLPAAFRFAYGPGSYARHLAQIPSATIVVAPELALDVDDPATLRRASRLRTGRWLGRFIASAPAETNHRATP